MRIDILMARKCIRPFTLNFILNVRNIFKIVSNASTIAIKCKYAHIICTLFPIYYTIHTQILRKTNKILYFA